MKRYKISSTTLCAAFALTMTAASVAAISPPLEYETWFVSHMGSGCWGEPGVYYELMIPAESYAFGDLQVCALSPENPYFGLSPAYERVLRGCHFWAEIWLANHVEPAVSRRVDAKLWSGFDGPVFLHSTASVMVANGAPGAKYSFDFGYFDTFDLILSRLWVEIVYYGPAGETHVYWNHPTCPTALRVEGTSIAVEAKTWGRIKSLFR